MRRQTIFLGLRHVNLSSSEHARTPPFQGSTSANLCSVISLLISDRPRCPAAALPVSQFVGHGEGQWKTRVLIHVAAPVWLAHARDVGQAQRLTRTVHGSAEILPFRVREKHTNTQNKREGHCTERDPAGLKENKLAIGESRKKQGPSSKTEANQHAQAFEVQWQDISAVGISKHCKALLQSGVGARSPSRMFSLQRNSSLSVKWTDVTDSTEVKGIPGEQDGDIVV